MFILLRIDPDVAKNTGKGEGATNGGAGLKTDAISTKPAKARSFLNGGAGGMSSTDESLSKGGFGCGNSGCMSEGGGGGGGYSGGDQGYIVGGGGGSFNSGDSQDREADFQKGPGKVLITVVRGIVGCQYCLLILHCAFWPKLS